MYYLCYSTKINNIIVGTIAIRTLLLVTLPFIILLLVKLLVLVLLYNRDKTDNIMISFLF